MSMVPTFVNVPARPTSSGAVASAVDGQVPEREAAAMEGDLGSSATPLNPERTRP
jgi:hypothetical protein